MAGGASTLLLIGYSFKLYYYHSLYRGLPLSSILRQLLDPHGIYPVVLTNPIGDYIRGDRGALRAFFDVANRAFRDYGLNLKPGNLANVKTVQDLVDVIANWFRRRGQLVT
jgi:hypothetical protein